MIQENQIICGNHLDVLSKFHSNCIDLTVTSPPYDNLRDYEGYKFNFERLANELFRVTKVGGVVVWVVGDATINGSETGTSFKQALYFKEIGFKLHDTMIYEKNNFAMPSSNRYHQIFEYIFIFSKNKPKTFNSIKDKKNSCVGRTCWGKGTIRQKDGSLENNNSSPKVINEFGMRTNIWRYIVGAGFNTTDKIAYQHPAIFPEKLARDHIISWSNESDIVLDPMCGSGTTLLEAKKLNRKYIGIDISKKYCELSEKRVIIDREHFEACEVAEKLKSSDFDDLLISNTTAEVSRLNMRCPTSSGEGRVEFPHADPKVSGEQPVKYKM